MRDFAIGFSTSPDTAAEYATKMAGWHNMWVLAVVDEAAQVAAQITTTIVEGLATNERVRVVLQGNPTDPECEFANACRLGGRLDHLYEEGMAGSHEPYMSDLGWWVIPISVRDTPNYLEGREVIPGLAGRDYEKRICQKHPVGSNGWLIRIQGAFPAFKEGTYYGHELSVARKEKRIGHSLDASVELDLSPELSDKLAPYVDKLRSIFIVSSVDFAEIVQVDGGHESETVPGLKVKVKLRKNMF